MSELDDIGTLNNTELLTNENFILFAARHYQNPHCLNKEEFDNDLLHLKYIKKLITRYVESNELKERLILNHLIILSNVFKPVILSKIIWLKMPEYLPYIKPFMILINVLPDKIYNVETEGVIDTDDVPMDQRIVDELRKIRHAT